MFKILFNNFFRSALILIILCTSTSCAANKINGSQGKKNSQETKSEEQKFDGKKLAKEGAEMIGWDIVLAAVCKNGLHFSVGICLAADVLGDTGIILYNNVEKVEAKDLENKKITDKNGVEKPKKHTSINPLEFGLSVGLMAIVLILI